MKRIGKGEDARWLVDYWAPRGSPKIPLSSNSALGGRVETAAGLNYSGTVAGYLSSPRRRRRLVRAGAVLGILGGLAAVGIVWSNTGESYELPLSNRPAQTAPTELVEAPLVGDRKVAAAEVARAFLLDGVVGGHVDRTWEIVTPAYRTGFTRTQWEHGITPVIPYRGQIDTVGVVTSYTDRVVLGVRLVPPTGEAGRPASFRLELKQGSDGGWKVDYFAPPATLEPDIPLPDRGVLDFERGSGGLDPIWLVIPVALVGGLVLLLALLGGRAWYRGARARRAYEASRLNLR
jgi:hypothetical protein